MLVRRFGPAERRADARPALFVDRDGVLNRRVVDGYVLDPDDLVILEGIIPVLAEAARLEAPIVIVSNQGCIARGLVDEHGVDAIHGRLLRRMAGAGVAVEAIYVCPHHPAAVHPGDRSCTCRKPLPGLLVAAADQLGLDLGRSVFIGDQESDRQAAQAAGIAEDRFLLVDAESLPAGRLEELTRSVRLALSGA